MEIVEFGEGLGRGSWDEVEKREKQVRGIVGGEAGAVYAKREVAESSSLVGHVGRDCCVGCYQSAVSALAKQIPTDKVIIATDRKRTSCCPSPNYSAAPASAALPSTSAPPLPAHPSRRPPLSVYAGSAVPASQSG